MLHLIEAKRNKISMEMDRWMNSPAGEGEAWNLAEEARSIANKFDAKIFGQAKSGVKIDYGTFRENTPRE